MKQIAPLALCALLAFTPVHAQDTDQNNDLSDGMGLLSEGTKLLLRGLMREIEPALRDLEGALQDLNAYHAPEILPNGDILIRRKEPKIPEPEEDEIDL